MRSVSDFIDELGVSKIAAARKKAYSTVASWKERGSIPVDEWPGLVDLARERGKDVDFETLVKMHTQPVS